MANRDSENSVLTREQVLALDIATHTGYFSLHEYRDMELHRKQTAQRQQDARRFQDYAALAAPSLRHPPRRAFEDVSVNRHFYDMRRLSELRGILLEVCDELDIPEPEFVNPAVLKKWATGDGHATKTQMVALPQGQIRYCPGG
ncbi:hypothetical protein NXX23_18165 [Bacteroides ovatus]|nr:hypothetical protein [Bacteroides ovatus]